MATGDVVNIKRPRFDANERLDQPDAEALSQAPRLHDDALTREVLVTPKATAGAPVGIIFTGGSVTANPSGPSDGLLRLNTELFVALDANGRALVKPAGTTMQVAIAGGGSQQVYAYYTEDQSDNALRRFVAPASPYAESAAAMNTRFAANIGLYTRAGNAASIVTEAVIGGQTVPLVFLCLASNAAGVVTPDLTSTTNRMSSITAAPSLPAGPTANGDMKTLHDMIKALAYMVGQVVWKNSANLAPGSSNNYGAWSAPPTGLDALNDAVGLLGGDNMFGTGVHGSATMDGGTGVTGCSLSTGNYTMLGDLSFQDLTINTTVTLFTNGYRLCVNGTLTLLGTAKIDNSGIDATGATGGAIPASAYVNGGGNVNGGAATNPGGNSSLAQAVGGAGGAGGGGTGGIGGTVTHTAPTAQEGSFYLPMSLYTGQIFGTTGSKVVHGGSAGGGGGGAAATNSGGGGGGGAGAIFIYARKVVLSATCVISANGGRGGNQTGAGGGGGGGGGGGPIVFFYRKSTGAAAPAAVCVANGGLGGTGQANGANGSAGPIIIQAI